MTRYALTDIIEELVGHPIPERSINAMIRCPLPTHPERDPSFSIHLDKGLWVCHACGEKGGLSKLARLLDREVNQDDIEVRRALELAKTVGFEEPSDFWDIAVRYELQRDEPIPPAVREFCVSRAINKPALFEYRIGYDEERRRIVFPYWDDGKCVAIKYRNVDHEGNKRFNKTSENGSKRTIMGIDKIRSAGDVILCEGESDTLATWSHVNKLKSVFGDIAVGGIPGADNTPDRWELWSLDMLWAKYTYIAFDADAAGDKGFARAQGVLGDKAVRLRPPDGMDMAQAFAEGHQLVLDSSGVLTFYNETGEI